MVVNLEKNVFYSNEVANAMITVNNSECKLKITEVEFQVTQKVKIGGKRWDGNFDILENKDKSGLSAGHAEITKMMQLNLDQIKYDVSKERKKKSGLISYKMVARTPEEIFQLSRVPPATHSKHAQIEYELNANV